MNSMHSDLSRLQEQRRRDTFDDRIGPATNEQAHLNSVIAQNQTAITRGWEELKRLTQVLETLTAQVAAGRQKNPPTSPGAGTLSNNSQLSSVAESKKESAQAG